MKQNPSRMGVGASSILLILVVVSLTLFASLALIQARGDAALTKKTAEGILAFYEADSLAQEKLAALDDALQQGTAPDSIDGIAKLSDGNYAFSIAANDGHTLFVSLVLSSGRCRVLAYRYINVRGWAEQGTGTLWQGG